MQVDLMRYTLNNSITSVVNDSWVGIAPSITGSLTRIIHTYKFQGYQ